MRGVRSWALLTLSCGPLSRASSVAQLTGRSIEAAVDPDSLPGVEVSLAAPGQPLPEVAAIIGELDAAREVREAQMTDQVQHEARAALQAAKAKIAAAVQQFSHSFEDQTLNQVEVASLHTSHASIASAASSGPSFLQQQQQQHQQQQQSNLLMDPGSQASSFTVNVHVANSPSMSLVHQQITDLDKERVDIERRFLHKAISELRELPSMIATEVQAQIGVQSRAILAKMIAVKAPLGLPQGFLGRRAVAHGLGQATWAQQPRLGGAPSRHGGIINVSLPSVPVRAAATEVAQPGFVSTRSMEQPRDAHQHGPASLLLQAGEISAASDPSLLESRAIKAGTASMVLPQARVRMVPSDIPYPTIGSLLEAMVKRGNVAEELGRQQVQVAKMELLQLANSFLRDELKHAVNQILASFGELL